MTYGRKSRVRRRLWLAIPLAGSLLLAACGSGESSSMQAALPISITLSPSTTIVSLGQSITVSATVYDQSNRGASWSISPITFGALSDQTPTSVTYTAPANFSVPTTVTVTATSITNPNVTSSVQISASPITIALSPPAAQAINQGGQLFVFPTLTNDTLSQGVTWSVSPASGAGSLETPQPFSVEYVAPPAVSSPTTVTITAKSVANSSATAALQITVFPSGAGLNTAVVRVDGGGVPGNTHANGAFTSVTICNPGSATVCQTVDGILVDTGSSGLRILQSQIPLLKLPTQVDSNANTLENCDSFVDGSYIWGPVAYADVYIGGETANSIGGQTAVNSVRVQVISSSNSTVPGSCSNGGTTNDNTPQLLGANGILGIGPEPTDCTLAGTNYCDGSVQPLPPNLYYTCPGTGCATTDSPVLVTKAQQVTNPIPFFSQDNNGVVLQLPPLPGSTASVTGLMVFGIGTESNNQLGSATVFTLDSSDNFTTLYNGQTLTRSFIDSGSNALYFPDLLPICTTSVQFFCPSSLTNLTATNQGATQGNNTVDFSVDNADNLFSTYPGFAAFSTLAGPEGTYNSCSPGSPSCSFDWGLPFFYGRSVYTAIDGQPAPSGAPDAPWWAY
jgi:Protein of unknown function (DUF3443)